jgi:sterol 3beta-glucosyltransferase/vancomycin aglycone glucosyltransferase
MLLADPSADSRRAATHLMIDAARQAGCRTIIQSSWKELDDLATPDTVYRLDRAPHSVLFSKCAAIVHHGGAGTTHAASRAGVPSIIVAHVSDQLSWARLMRDRGLAPGPLQRRSVTAPKLAASIRKVLGDQAMRERAVQVGKKMAQEDGVRRAIEPVEGRYGGGSAA